MEEIVSFLSHIAGAVLFCAALTMLFMIGEREEIILEQLGRQKDLTVWYSSLSVR